MAFHHLNFIVDATLPISINLTAGNLSLSLNFKKMFTNMFPLLGIINVLRLFFSI
jgi:hypothetical protein